MKEQKIISFEYPLIILLAIFGLLLMCNSNDFLITYLAIELATLAFYILASFQKTSSCSVDAAVKYARVRRVVEFSIQNTSIGIIAII